MARLNLTTQEVAERLRVSVNTLNNWRWTGGGPHFIKFGRVILYPVAELEAFETSHLMKSVHVPVTPDPATNVRPAETGLEKQRR